jgi:hypothetical protein
MGSNAVESWFDSRLGHRPFFLLSAHLTRGSTEFFFLDSEGRIPYPGDKATGKETHYYPSSSVGIKNMWSHTSTPPYVFMTWCCVNKSDNSTFTLNPYISYLTLEQD